MIGVLVFLGLCVALVYRSIQKIPGRAAKTVTSKRTNPQLDAAMNYANRLYAERKYLAAEKAYLEAIKLDHKNVAAYSRLGKIYSALNNFADAVECSQIAAQLSPNAQTYSNLGTAYFENKNFIKAIASFEKSIMLEPSAGRYIGLGRIYQRMQSHAKAIAAFEKAVELDANRAHLQLLLEAYKNANNLEMARTLQQRLAALEA